MEILQNLLRIMDVDMERPGLYGWFHLLWLGITILTAVALCRWYPKDRKPHGLILTVTVAMILLEIYKQINYSFSYTNGITYDYQWYAFPFQFCSTPMYVGLLAALTRKGRIHDAACAYLATFAVFAGVCVMLYPADVFIDTVGINIQTMICHGSMIFLGVYLLYSGYVKLEHKTVLKAAAVFAVCVGLAMGMNELAHATGLLERETFNMFFISPYCAPSLPVYSLVQRVVPYPLNLVIYIAGFTLAAYLILLVAMGVRRLGQRKVVAKVS
ncbi:MAG: YwaF family protein [Oscillospiraceae bacterium]|nr:YwaF family protein [Oscillospiraceae bacterium]